MCIQNVIEGTFVCARFLFAITEPNDSIFYSLTIRPTTNYKLFGGSIGLKFPNEEIGHKKRKQTPLHSHTHKHEIVQRIVRKRFTSN